MLLIVINAMILWIGDSRIERGGFTWKYMLAGKKNPVLNINILKDECSLNPDIVSRLPPWHLKYKALKYKDTSKLIHFA